MLIVLHIHCVCIVCNLTDGLAMVCIQAGSMSIYLRGLSSDHYLFNSAQDSQEGIGTLGGGPFSISSSGSTTVLIAKVLSKIM